MRDQRGTVPRYDEALLTIFKSSQEAGEAFVDVNSMKLRDAVLGRAGNTGLAACRNVLRSAMVPGDSELWHDVRRDVVAIRFCLPRPQNRGGPARLSGPGDNAGGMRPEQLHDRIEELRAQMEMFLTALDQFKADLRIAGEFATITRDRLVRSLSDTDQQLLFERPSAGNLYLDVVRRMTAEFGDSQSSMRWNIAPSDPSRASINIQVDGGKGGKFIRVWIFDPAGESQELYEDVACEEDLDRVIARIRRAAVPDPAKIRASEHAKAVRKQAGSNTAV